MSSEEYKVQTNQGLSKPYTRDKLERKLELGLVPANIRITQDDGETWTTLSTLLKEPATPAPTSRATKKVRPLRRAPRADLDAGADQQSSAPAEIADSSGEENNDDLDAPLVADTSPDDGVLLDDPGVLEDDAPQLVSGDTFGSEADEGSASTSNPAQSTPAAEDADEEEEVYNLAAPTDESPQLATGSESVADVFDLSQTDGPSESGSASLADVFDLSKAVSSGDDTSSTAAEVPPDQTHTQPPYGQAPPGEPITAPSPSYQPPAPQPGYSPGQPPAPYQTPPPYSQAAAAYPQGQLGYPTAPGQPAQPQPKFEKRRPPVDSPIAEAAQAALRAVDGDRGKRSATADIPPPPGKTSDAKFDLRIDDNEDTEGSSGSRTKQLLAIVTIVCGLGAAAFLGWWQLSDRKGSTLDILSENQFARLQESGVEDATVESLAAKMQIVGYQVQQLRRAMTSKDFQPGATGDLEIPDLPKAPSLPLVPFIPRQLTAQQRSAVDDKMTRFAKLYQERGADGRKIDEASVNLFSGYLTEVIAHVDGTSGSSRAGAVNELAELTKVLYLLQLGNIRSGSDSKQDAAAELLLTSPTDALKSLYMELQAGDMRFADIFLAATDSEQRGLLLTRYWYYRAADRRAADTWLKNMLDLIDKSEHAAVRSSIAEVDRIE